MFQSSFNIKGTNIVTKVYFTIIITPFKVTKIKMDSFPSLVNQEITHPVSVMGFQSYGLVIIKSTNGA